jgi:MoxR-like ATPase
MVKALSNNRLVYTGRVQPKQGERDTNGQPLYPYLPDEGLVEAVNLAIYLNRPLLIKGEPGCGKTRLARAVAYELGLPYEAWHVKSTSRARDGLYTYDNVGRLRDAQLAGAGRLKYQDNARIDDPTSYVQWGPLGRAFRNEQRSVVLIDEIDKADIDFPNDLLLELDEQRFIVEETGQEVQARRPPIVFITSNDEKDLPDAFLRRCLFHYVKFPDEARLADIVKVHFPETSKKLIGLVVQRFLELRKEMYEDKGDVGKKVSTSELIDWFSILHHYSQDEILAKLDGKLPYPSILLKSWDDHRRYLTGERTRRL